MKSGIEIVSASAGSGKTYKLATLLEQELAAERVRPENVIATTFTRRAAAELQSRARRHLLTAGRADDAQALAAARIGTVHAVCGRIVSDYAFELGLSPDLGVLDEVAAKVAFRRALTRVIETSPEADALDEVARRFGATAPRGARQKEWKRASQLVYDWRAAVGDILEHARMNGLHPDRFAQCAQDSIEGIRQLLSAPAGTAEQADRALIEGLEAFVEQAPCEGDATKATIKAVESAKGYLPRLRRGATLPWVDWVRLLKLAPGKKSASAIEALHIAAGAFDWHPRLHADLDTLITGTFAVAARAARTYAEYKRVRGVMDFGDHEVLALRALRMPEVREQLSAELELALVDEFQDTSPLQLAIFLELASLAPRSVWVGDQKQSIYAFRGADPALMDAVIKGVLGNAQPETLGTSYRSRPQLVRVCSELFAHSFVPQGIGPAQVRLEPALAVEPEGLGPCIERWVLDTKNKDGDTGSVAGLVEDLLADPSVRVRDPHSGHVRPVRPGDVAVVCRYNDTCDRMAHALAGRNIHADLRRTGLLRTLEAMLAMAGLALFVAPRNRAAAAQVVRLHQEDPNDPSWLEDVLTSGDTDPLLAHPVVERILQARRRNPHAGPLVALDLVLEALQVREAALRWGNSAMRLANLDALRDHAAALVGRTDDEGQSTTPSGLLDGLRALDGGEDGQALLGDGEGVVVTTWHASKGLEWPITVLFEISAGERFHPFDVQPVAAPGEFSFDKPLEDRWVRFWPNPYGGQKKGVPLMERLETHPAMQVAIDKTRSETLRVLYVGMTRARDRLILAGREGQLPGSDLKALVDDTGEPLITEPAPSPGLTQWAGEKLEVALRRGSPKDELQDAPTPGSAPQAPGPQTHPDAFLSPSAVEEEGSVIEVQEIGPGLQLLGEPDMQSLGEALHGFLAADRGDLDQAARLALATGLLRRWGVDEHLAPEAALQASDALRNWANTTHPNATWKRELPMQHRFEAGTILRGTADLVLMSDDHIAVIDHKSYADARPKALQKAAATAGQLKAYAGALEAATAIPTITTWVHLPVAGLMVRVTSVA